MPGTVPQRSATKVGRNEPCPCGSGKKYKDCHYAEGQAFLDRLNLQEEKRRRKEKRRRLKEQGVPWYRRLFAR
jgi:hypothetical protein